MKFQLFYFLFGFVALTSVGCEKLGCQDKQSINYDEKAKKDDGSCVFVSNLTIWFNAAQSSTLQSNNITDLRFYLSGVFIGSTPSTDFAFSAPNCGDTVVFTQEITLGKIEKKDYTLIVRDQNDNFLLTKSFILEGNGCYLYQLN